ncbi:MAG: anti-sigma factor [Myxococcota bacterium]|nr:anti-sigma factor [Myxococcota bacterium]
MTELATDYVEGATPMMTRVAMWMHLAMCRHCREYLRQYRATIAALGQLPVEPPPAACREELLRRFRDPGS